MKPSLIACEFRKLIDEVLGDHDFLPLAWYAAFSHCRMHKIKLDKSRPSLEIYHDNPVAIDDSNTIKTILYVAVK